MFISIQDSLCKGDKKSTKHTKFLEKLAAPAPKQPVVKQPVVKQLVVKQPVVLGRREPSERSFDIPQTQRVDIKLDDFYQLDFNARRDTLKKMPAAQRKIFARAYLADRAEKRSKAPKRTYTEDAPRSLTPQRYRSWLRHRGKKTFKDVPQEKLSPLLWEGGLERHTKTKGKRSVVKEGGEELGNIAAELRRAQFRKDINRSFKGEEEQKQWEQKVKDKAFTKKHESKVFWPWEPEFQEQQRVIGRKLGSPILRWSKKTKKKDRGRPLKTWEDWRTPEARYKADSQRGPEGRLFRKWLLKPVAKKLLGKEWKFWVNLSKEVVTGKEYTIEEKPKGRVRKGVKPMFISAKDKLSKAKKGSLSHNEDQGAQYKLRTQTLRYLGLTRNQLTDAERQMTTRDLWNLHKDKKPLTHVFS